jgi:hypothetical protein
MYRAKLDRSFQVFDTPPNANDPCRQSLPAENHTQRTADQPHSDNRDLYEMQCHLSRWPEANLQS